MHSVFTFWFVTNILFDIYPTFSKTRFNTRPFSCGCPHESGHMRCRCKNYLSCPHFPFYGRLICPANQVLLGGRSHSCNLLSILLRCGTRPYKKGYPMRLELTRVGLLVELANHYTTRRSHSCRQFDKCIAYPGKCKYQFRGCPSGVMVKAMDCEIVVSEFVLQSRYYVHLRANTLGKGMNPLIHPAMG